MWEVCHLNLSVLVWYPRTKSDSLAGYFTNYAHNPCEYQMKISHTDTQNPRKLSTKLIWTDDVGFFVVLSSVQLLSRVWLFAAPWTAARQASLSITNSRSLPKPMSIESVMPSNHLILCRPLLLLPSIFPSIRVFSNESVLRIRWPKYWSFSFNSSPPSEHPGLISFRMDWLDLLCGATFLFIILH